MEGLAAFLLVCLTYKVPDEGAVEVGDLLHAPRDVSWTRGPTGVTTGLFLVVVVAEDKAQQEAGHHDVPDAQHGEVTSSGAATTARVREAALYNLYAFCSKSVSISRYKGSLLFCFFWFETGSHGSPG